MVVLTGSTNGVGVLTAGGGRGSSINSIVVFGGEGECSTKCSHSQPIMPYFFAPPK